MKKGLFFSIVGSANLCIALWYCGIQSGFGAAAIFLISVVVFLQIRQVYLLINGPD